MEIAATVDFKWDAVKIAAKFDSRSIRDADGNLN